MKRYIQLAGMAISIVGVLAGCGQSSNLPSWMSISANDVSSISIQGWGPGAEGSFVINPPAGQLASLINSLVNQLPKDKAIKPYVTAIGVGGTDWLVVKLKNGTSIEFVDFPNDPTPIQYHVTLTSKSGKQEKSAMISDDSGVVTSTIHEITNKGVMVREKNPLSVTPSSSKPVSRLGFSADALSLLGVQGKLPVFGGTINHLTSKSIPSSLPSALPNGYQARVQFTSATRFIPYTPQEFHIRDAWSGTLYGKPFILNVYENTANDTAAYAQHQPRLFLVGLSYNGRPMQAVVFNKLVWWVRFTANFATFATPNPANGNPIYALDLVTGQFISDNRAVNIAGFYDDMRGGYSGEIAGLPSSSVR